MSNIPVCFVGSRNLTSQTAVAMVSMAMNTKSNIDFYIIDCDLPADDFRILQSICDQYKNIKSLTVYPIDRALFHRCNTWHGHSDIWARFYFPQLAPHIDRAIYMDSDTLVIGDIQKIYDMDLDGHAVAAAPEIAFLGTEWQKLKNERYEILNLPNNHLYFCSGVLVMDCKKWRDENITEHIMKIGRERGMDLKYPDQDAMNLFFANDYAQIHNEFCSTTNDLVYMLREQPDMFLRAQKNMIIRHFNVYKPFAKDVFIDGTHMCEHLENWWYYASLTPYWQYFLHKQNIQKPTQTRPVRNINYRLFGFIPLLKIMQIKTGRHAGQRVWLLFNHIPVLRVKQ
jgi:lipopolysaccharide biosynthesis glycosyltransferase